MDNSLIAAPHAHDHSSVSRIMLQVCWALVPCTLFGLYQFGFPAINLFVLTVASAIGWESLCLYFLKKPQHQLMDGSALLTGWLLALTLPPWAPWWLAVGGSFVAIVVGKQIFGGLGQNVFNPAMLARVALLISFPVQMTVWPITGLGFSDISFVDGLKITADVFQMPDGYTGASALGHLKTELSIGHPASQIINEDFSVWNSILGNTTGSLGETSALLILCGGVWLLFKRIISWHIPVAMLGSCAVLAQLFHWIDPDQYADFRFHLFSGAMMLGAFFIATDMVTSPSSKSGQLVFGVGCGSIAFIIRTWGTFPEAVGFGVLFMNALTPLIDIYFRPRVYGRTYGGTPKRYQQEGETS